MSVRIFTSTVTARDLLRRIGYRPAKKSSRARRFSLTRADARAFLRLPGCATRLFSPMSRSCSSPRFPNICWFWVAVTLASNLGKCSAAMAAASPSFIRGRRLFLARNNLRPLMNDGDAAAIAAEHLPKFEANVTATQNQQMFGNRGELHDRLIGEKRRVAQPGNRRNARASARVNENLLALDDFFAGL